MKLARPDVFHPRIVLAGSPDRPQGDADDADLIAALRRRGLHARWVSWDDPATVEADLVILRAADDLAERFDEFAAWTRRVRRLLNPPAAVLWNADERYRDDLARCGIAVSPVVGEPVPKEPVTALVFLGGEQSHAFTDTPVDADWEVWEFGHRTLTAAAHHLGLAPEELLCARVEVAGDHRDPRLVRLDLVAPSLGWRRLDPDARAARQRQFVLAVEAALDRFGLGPLSHRRP